MRIAIFDIVSREGAIPVAREKFQTLTEQMFYILLALQEERCGADVMNLVSQITWGRVTVGPGTLYNLLEDFQSAGMIVQTKVEGRRRSYQITQKGRDMLWMEKRRLEIMLADFQHMTAGNQKTARDSAG